MNFLYFHFLFVELFLFLGVVKLTIIVFRDGINQILVRISRSPMAVLVQFSGRLLISVVGSKIENRFHIIFIFVLLTLMIFCVFICLFGDWAKYFMMLSVRNVARTVMLQYCLFCRYYLRYKRIYF